MRLEDIGPGTIIAGRFEIKERIGAGGMGMVFRALDQELGNHVVAIKLLLPHLAADAQIFRRFLNEVLVARSLSHPNICRIHDIGKAEGGFHYISMEYVDGESLRERLLSGAPTSIDGTTVRVSPLSFEEAVSILFAVAGGVAYAHEKGVIHRDLKPANILMNKKGEVKLADFGTARIMGMDTSLTQTGQVIGTPDYMSPEQIRGENLDSACDIYALGIIGYELVTAQRPFVADSAVAVAFKHLSEPLPSLAPYSIPEWYQELVVKAAAKDKADRFRSGTDFCAEIQRNLPEIVKQTGYYPASSTMQNRTPSTPRNDPPTPPPGPLENPAPIVPPAAKQDSPTVHNVVESDSLRFELGNPSTLEGSEQWALSGSNSLSGRDSRNNAMLPLIIGFLTLALLGTLFILFRDTIFPVGEPDNRPPREVVVPSTQHVQEQLNQTPVPTSIPELKPTEIAVLVPSQTVLIPTAVPAVTIAVVGPTSAPAELATEVPTAVAPTPQPTLAPTVAPTLAPTVAPTVTTAPLPTISSVTGSFSLESHGTKVRDIEITQLADLTWSAVLKGAENTTGKVSLIVVSSRTKRTVGSTGPLEQSRQADGSIAVEGTLGGIVDRLEAGEYRVDLTYNGTVLVSKRLNVTETVMPQPTEAAIDDPGPQPTSNGGLGVPVGQTPIAEEQYGAAENYSGSIEWPDGSGSATRKALKLELQFGTTSVMGRAEIEGFGEFRVSGEVLPRGLSLTLRGPEFGIRLVSGKRSDMLRGTFMPPGEKTQRSFEAKKQ